MKPARIILGLLYFVTTSSMAFASIANDSNISMGFSRQATTESTTVASGQRYILTSEKSFYVIRNNVPMSDQPNAAQAGSLVTIPAGATIDIIDNPQFNPLFDPKFGRTVNIGLDVENESEIPADFVVQVADLMTAQAQLVDKDLLDAQLEYAFQNMSQEEAVALDQQESENSGYFTQDARTHGRSQGHAGRGGGHHAGMTYCLQNVEIKAKQMGICPYKISEGYARRSLPGFREKCNMHDISTRIAATSMPIGTICVSHGSGRPCAGGKSICGDAKIKIGKGTWYNGLGGSTSSNAIGVLYGCVVSNRIADDSTPAPVKKVAAVKPEVKTKSAPETVSPAEPSSGSDLIVCSEDKVLPVRDSNLQLLFKATNGTVVTHLQAWDNETKERKNYKYIKIQVPSHNGENTGWALANDVQPKNQCPFTRPASHVADAEKVNEVKQVAKVAVAPAAAPEIVSETKSSSDSELVVCSENKVLPVRDSKLEVALFTATNGTPVTHMQSWDNETKERKIRDQRYKYIKIQIPGRNGENTGWALANDVQPKNQCPYTRPAGHVKEAAPIAVAPVAPVKDTPVFRPAADEKVIEVKESPKVSAAQALAPEAAPAPQVVATPVASAPKVVEAPAAAAPKKMLAEANAPKPQDKGIFARVYSWFSGGK